MRDDFRRRLIDILPARARRPRETHADFGKGEAEINVLHLEHNLS